MFFLQNTDGYSAMKAVDQCRANEMHKEEAYLLIKMGKKEEAIRVLIDHCENVSDVIDLAVEFNINDDLLWDEILLKSLGKTDKIN